MIDSRSEVKVPFDVEKWRSNPECAYAERVDAPFLTYVQQRRKRVLTATVIIVTFLAALGVLTYFGAQEMIRMRGMTFLYRNESLPVALPVGQPQLRTINRPFSNPDHNMGTFTPFIASTQQPGEISVVTNVTSPSYHAYTVRHPEIMDIVMITEAFFCGRRTCLFVMDGEFVHNKSFFERPVTEFWDLTKQLVEVPLPAGMSFAKAELCPHLHDRKCHIVMRNAGGQYHFGAIIQHSLTIAPVIEDVGAVEFPKGLTTEKMEMQAFRRTPDNDRLVVWYDGGLAVVLIDHKHGQQYSTIIDDVGRDEVVEMYTINEEHLAVIVMREVEEEKGRVVTRVRINIVRGRNHLERQDELIIHNRPTAITILNRDETFEICELAGASLLKCYVNS